MAGSAVKCPECVTVLKLPAALPAGKKLRCPKCGTIFLSPAAPPPPPQRVEAPLAELDDESESTVEIDDDDEEMPARPKRRRKQSNNALIIGVVLGAGALLLLVVIAGLVLPAFFAGENRGTGEEDPLAYLPANCNLIFGFDVDALAKVPEASARVNLFLVQAGCGPWIEDSKKTTGLKYGELFNQLTVGLEVTTAMMNPNPRAGPPKPSPGTLVIRTKTPFSQRRIANSLKNPQKKKWEGKAFYQVTENVVTTLFMPSDRTIILTDITEDKIPALVVSDGATPQMDMATLIQTMRGSNFWLSVKLEGAIRQQIQSQIPKGLPVMPPQMAPVIQVMQNAKAAGLWGSLEGQQLSVNVGVQCVDAANASQLTGALKSSWQKEGKGLGAMAGLALLPPAQKAFAKDILQSLQFSQQNSLALASARINLQSLQDLANSGQPGGGNPFQRRMTPPR